MVKKSLILSVFLALQVFAVQAHAGDEIDSYIAQKRAQAQQAESRAAAKIEQLKSQPKDVMQIADITPPPAKSDFGAVSPLAEQDFGAIETAAGKMQK